MRHEIVYVEEMNVMHDWFGDRSMLVWGERTHKPLHTLLLKCAFSRSAHKGLSVQVTCMEKNGELGRTEYVINLQLCVITATSKMVRPVAVLALVQVRPVHTGSNYY